MRYTAAAIQFDPIFGAQAANIARLLALTEAAARNGAKLIVLPEMATTGYCFYDRAEVRPFVEPIPGPTTAAFAEVAARYGCYVVIGMPEIAPRTNIYYNSAALVGPQGVVGVYRKTHSFIAEPKWAKDGDLGLPVWETEIGRVGVMICMDGDYFEPARLLALGGAQVICFPTNWLDDKSPSAPWMARAYENGCALVSANRYGEERGVQFSGGSCVLAPDGTVQAMRDDGEGIVYGAVDSEATQTSAWLAARRPELYDNLTLNTYLWNPHAFHGLYDQRPLPSGRRSHVAVVQMTIAPTDKTVLMAQLEQYAEECAAADLIVFPEYALTGATSSNALTADEASALLLPLAQRGAAQIVAGFAERDGDRCYSTALLVGAGGVLARYRKAHVVGAEREWISAGDAAPPVVDLPLGRVGLLLGTDLCFPEICRVLALEGCDLLAVPAGAGLPPVQPLGATDVPVRPPSLRAADPAHFHIARQRAIENNCYVAFASPAPPHGIGSSGIFGPAPHLRAGETLLTDDGALTSEIDTTSADRNYPTNPVRAKDLVRMRQPALYDALQALDTGAVTG